MRLAAVHLRATIAQIYDDIKETDPTDTVLLFTALTLLFHRPLYGLTEFLMITIFVWPRLRKNPLLWLAALVLLSVAGMSSWYKIDNHQYLLIYWCLSVFLMLLTDVKDRTHCIERSSSILIALVMLLACAQKLRTPSYTDGSFFEYTLLFDQRFVSIAWLIGGVTPFDLEENRLLQQQMANSYLSGSLINSVNIYPTDQIRWLSVGITWFAVLFEGAIGILFLFPNPSNRLHFLRACLLIIFIITTYAIAPVIGFGQLIITMALASVPFHYKKLRLILMALFLILPFFDIFPPVKILQLMMNFF